MRRALRVAAVAEAGTYLLLLAAAAQRRLVAGSDWVHPVGLLHGLVFLAYLALVLAVGRRRSWSPVEVVTMLAAAFVPLGTVLAERRIDRHGGLVREVP